MPCRALLARRPASVYLIIYFYRRLLQAAIIIYFYYSPTMQVILSLYLNLSYTIYIMVFRVIEDPFDRLKEIINELVIIVTIYFLMLFLGEYVADAEKREQLGIAFVIFTMFNFIINIIPPLFTFLRSILRRCRSWY